MIDKVDFSDVTFLIPVWIDSLGRLENLVCISSYLLKYFNTNITVLETDEQNNGLIAKLLPPQVTVQFESDTNPIFYRTKYIYLGLI